MASGDRQNTSPPEKNGDGLKSQSKRKMTDKEQSEQFIETARELGADLDNQEFDHLLKKILPNNQDSQQE